MGIFWICGFLYRFCGGGESENFASMNYRKLNNKRWLKKGRLVLLENLNAGLQHVLAMYAGAVIVPLIVGPAIGLSVKELEYLISIDLFMCGIATLLQVIGGKHIGGL